jgi:hypothetical protein
VRELREASLAEKEEPKEGGLQEKREDPLHRQWLADDAAGNAGELRPVGAELELHGNAGDHTQQKIDREDLRPEAHRLIPALLARAQGNQLHHHHQQRQTHRQLREQVVEGDSKRKVDTVQQEGVHANPTVTGVGASAL